MFLQKNDYERIDQDYRRKVAIVTWRNVALRGVFGIILAFVAVAGLFFLATSVFYLVQGSFSDRALVAAVFDGADVMRQRLRANAPLDLRFDEPVVVPAVEGSDILALVENVNAQHYATFSYRFIFDGGETQPQVGYINPAQSTYLSAFGVPVERRANVRLHIDAIAWHLVDRHAIDNTEQWLAQRNDFPVAQVEYASESAQGATVTFALTNNTTFSFWQPAFFIILQKGQTIIGVSRITVSDFLRGETRSVSARLFGSFPPTATVRVVPDIFFFDPGVYKDV